MFIRNLLLLVSAAFFVIAFFVMSDGCVGYSGDAPNQVCLDPSGVGQTISQAAHLLFAGLAILSAALIDYDSMLNRTRTNG